MMRTYPAVSFFLGLLLFTAFPVFSEQKADAQHAAASSEAHATAASNQAFDEGEHTTAHDTDILLQASPAIDESTTPAEQDDSHTAQMAPSYRYHVFEGGVSAITDSEVVHSFFAAGNDGFITRYTHSELKPETYQITNMPIKFIAAHPKKNYLAVYATDEFSTHIISIWDWTQKKAIYTQRFTSAVLSLAWSAKGTYLFIGTASLEGITVLDTAGHPKHIYPNPPGIVLLAATGPNEKNIVTYGETGRLVYANIAKANIITQYTTENHLQTPELIKNYTHLVGYKDGNVFVIKATSGEVVKQYPARSAIFAGQLKDTLPVWIERGNDITTWQLCQGEQKSDPFTLPNHSTITAARHGAAGIIIGTNDGRLYRLHQSNTSHTTLAPLTPELHTKIVDICTKDSTVYVLTQKALYMLDKNSQTPHFYAENPQANHCIPYQNGFLLWTNTRAAPLYYVEKDAEPLVLYHAKEALNSVSVHDQTIALAHTFSGLRLINGTNKHQHFVYHATGLQEALQINEELVLIAKSATDSTGYPLLLINIHTGETIPIKVAGDLAFALTAHPHNKNDIACIRLRSEGHTATELVSLHIDTGSTADTTFQTLLSYDDENLHAFIHKTAQHIITNLGNSALTAYDNSHKQRRLLKRDYALPQKAVSTDEHIVSLNYDSSLSWFNKKDLQLIQTTHIHFDE
ncbi:MAG: hypothetical protein ACTTJ7_04800 [Treponema sp.]